ncbi:ly6/PLAUR domain-containing protein 4 [Peromyscus californicus insignis]|uniref:ly6/PLAUR domain-containing protein 4 n=1 Tax=Peromyscus californicus insignis TaxID=564181 RepID=UPI0022A66BA6|nr:ly6/PLAUR domain-containing protein 4 [Peromyscus californicus insignis]XP_052568552.1 ly6/PLAUR domain-containing protein 4 [Peromyscus californicus insignis]
MGLQDLRSLQLLCLLEAISLLPWTEALLCYEATASAFRAVTLHNWNWLLLRSMVCKLKEGCEETIVYIETGTSRGIVSFKGCTSALSYPPQISYLVSPPGVSVASYSRVCRSYLCNNITNLEPFVRLKAGEPKHTASSAKHCPTCVGRHDQECLPNFVTTEACPFAASSCYSSTLQFQAGNLNTTFLIMGCAHNSDKLLANFQHIGSIRVTEVVNILEKSEAAGAGHCSQGPPWSILLGPLLIFRD